MIARGQLQSAKIEFTNNTVGQEVLVIVKHIAGYPRKRLSDTVGILCGVLTVSVTGTAYSILRRTIAIDKSDITITGNDFLTRRLASNKNCLQGRCGIFMTGMQECWWDTGPGDLFLFHQLEQAFRVFLHRLRSRYQCGTGQQRTENVNDRSIEDIGRELNDAVVSRRTIGTRRAYGYHCDDAAVRNNNALGLTCGS